MDKDATIANLTNWLEKITIELQDITKEFRHLQQGAQVKQAIPNTIIEPYSAQ